jgi:hypothetical protein
MQFKLRNNTEAITGFIQGMVIDYDYNEPILKHFMAMEVEVNFKDKYTEVVIHTWVNSGDEMPTHTIALLPDSTIEYLHKQTMLAIEAIHEDYLKFYSR